MRKIIEVIFPDFGKSTPECLISSPKCGFARSSHSYQNLQKQEICVRAIGWLITIEEDSSKDLAGAILLGCPQARGVRILQRALQMSDLTFSEKHNLEKLLGMGNGYVLDFSNRTFQEFVFESTTRDIFDAKYDNASGSKANRLRAFWKAEPNYLVGKLLSGLLERCKRSTDTSLYVKHLRHGSIQRSTK